MSRRVHLPILEKGPDDLKILFLRGWEEDWAPLQGTRYESCLTIVDKATEDHAYRRWSRPLAEALGPSPEGCLHKIPSDARQCFKRRECQMHMKRQCHVFGDKMPWCFEPGVPNESVRKSLALAI